MPKAMSSINGTHMIVLTDLGGIHCPKNVALNILRGVRNRKGYPVISDTEYQKYRIDKKG